MRWRWTLTCVGGSVSLALPLQGSRRGRAGRTFAWAAMADLSEPTVGCWPVSSSESGKRVEGLLERGFTVTRILAAVLVEVRGRERGEREERAGSTSSSWTVTALVPPTACSGQPPRLGTAATRRTLLAAPREAPPLVVVDMEAAQLANAAIAQSYSKDKKVGEGTYAVVYLGKQLTTGRKIAIKKVRPSPPPPPSPTSLLVLTPSSSRRSQIKVGQFKDGLDMSAIREVTFLRELRHPNVIEVRSPSLSFVLLPAPSQLTHRLSLARNSSSTSSPTRPTSTSSSSSSTRTSRPSSATRPSSSRAPTSSPGCS